MFLLYVYEKATYKGKGENLGMEQGKGAGKVSVCHGEPLVFILQTTLFVYTRNYDQITSSRYENF